MKSCASFVCVWVRVPTLLWLMCRVCSSASLSAAWAVAERGFGFYLLEHIITNRVFTYTAVRRSCGITCDLRVRFWDMAVAVAKLAVSRPPSQTTPKTTFWAAVCLHVLELFNEFPLLRAQRAL